MKNEVIPFQDHSQYEGSALPVTQFDLNTLDDQRKMLAEFVKNQLRETIDFGVIPGTPKPSLLKPGAEKLGRLFGLSSHFAQTSKELDREGGFAMYSYKCEVIHMKTGRVIAECEGSANSSEKKYAKQAIPDILNTLMKMAQKRAYVGAIILATGASDFFTQDLEDAEEGGRTKAKAGTVVDVKGFESDAREAMLDNLLKNLSSIRISQTMIRKKYKLGPQVSLNTLTDSQRKELDTIGFEITRRGKSVADFFEVK